MKTKLIYSIDDYLDEPTVQVGHHAKKIAELFETGSKTPKSIVIAKETLKTIAHANNLQAKIYKLIQSTKFGENASKTKTAQKIKNLIIQQSIPREIGKILLDNIEPHFHNSFVKITNSTNLNNKIFEIENIIGETSIITAILEVWAKTTHHVLINLKQQPVSTHEILFPTPVLLIEQIEADASGSVLTFNNTTGNKNQLTIYSEWGVNANQSRNDHVNKDKFIVDVRTHNIIEKNIAEKPTRVRRVNTKTNVDPVIKSKQDQPSLTKDQIQKLTKITTEIKRRYLSHLEIVFSVKDKDIFIEDFDETEININNPKTSLRQTKKIFSIVENFPTVKKVKDLADGLCVYNSAQLLSITGEHPLHLTKSKRGEYLIKAIASTLNKYQKHTELPIIYRSQNFTSFDLSKLKFATNYEEIEPNPYLGFRGALRILSQVEVFKLELEILKKLESAILLIPFVRSPDELSAVYKIIEKSGLIKSNKTQLWLEINTPENVFNLRNYPLHLISGLVINYESLKDLMLGVDPQNPSIKNRYTLDKELFTLILDSISNSIKLEMKTISIYQKPKLYVQFDQYQKDQIGNLANLPEIDGLIVKSNHLNQVRQDNIWQQ
jgi:phosphoenolpyruvate synthase/pyruvate phosphate dikinase